MSNRLVVLVLVLMVAVGALTLLVLRSGSGGGGGAGGASAGWITQGERVVLVDPSQVERAVIRRINVGASSGSAEELRRSSDGVWTVRNLSENAGTRAWVVASDRATGFLRLVQQLRSAGVMDREPTIAAEAGRYEVDFFGTGEKKLATFTLGARVLGGQTVALCVGDDGVKRGAVVGDDLAKVLATPALAWRERSMLAAAGLEAAVRGATLIELNRGEGSTRRSVTLSKLNGRWRMTAPVACTADEAAVGKVLSVLQGVTITRFSDELGQGAAGGAGSQGVTMESAGLTNPRAVARVEVPRREIDGRTGEVKISTQEVVLKVGGIAPGNASGGSDPSVWATIDNGATIVAVSGVGLASLNLDAAGYVDRRATAIEAADVRVVEVVPRSGAQPTGEQRGARFTRLEESPGVWAELRGVISEGGAGGGGTALDEQRSGEVRAVLEMLTKNPAGGATLTAPEGYTVFGTVRLRSREGTLLDEVEIGEARGGDGKVAILVRTVPRKDLPSRGEVFRSYSTVATLLQRELSMTGGPGQ
ncbi:MAG: hypothetical protein IBJ18_09050 [Phycisphaerales bacterium]|nr:hypothetical protein [Phycisphaerales bacterium]